MGRYDTIEMILHFGHGSQYTSEECKKELKEAWIVQSFITVARCYDNARMESFFTTLKKELVYKNPTYRMKREAVKRMIFEYVFTYYNRKRIYTANPGGLPPEIYRKRFQEKASSVLIN